jgi:hypothetical protein
VALEPEVHAASVANVAARMATEKDMLLRRSEPRNLNAFTGVNRRPAPRGYASAPSAGTPGVMAGRACDPQCEAADD